LTFKNFLSAAVNIISMLLYKLLFRVMTPLPYIKL